MRLEQKLRTYGGVPLMHGTLLSILGEYRSPNDKIIRMIDDGLLQPIRKGLYAVSPEITGIPLFLSLVANLLYGPSYFSMDYVKCFSLLGLFVGKMHVLSETFRTE